MCKTSAPLRRHAKIGTFRGPGDYVFGANCGPSIDYCQKNWSKIKADLDKGGKMFVVVQNGSPVLGNADDAQWGYFLPYREMDSGNIELVEAVNDEDGNQITHVPYYSERPTMVNYTKKLAK